MCSRFLCEVDECASDNKMNCGNLGTIFGPHLLRPRTENPQILMECNNISTNFVRVVISHLSELFPLTSDERAPKRLSVVFQPDVIPPWLNQSDSAVPTSKVAHRSVYQAKSRYISFRPRQNSAPAGHKGKCMIIVQSVSGRYGGLFYSC